jgi:hypothetical protein
MDVSPEKWEAALELDQKLVIRIVHEIENVLVCLQPDFSFIPFEEVNSLPFLFLLKQSVQVRMKLRARMKLQPPTNLSSTMSRVYTERK